MLLKRNTLVFHHQDGFISYVHMLVCTCREILKTLMQWRFLVRIDAIVKRLLIISLLVFFNHSVFSQSLKPQSVATPEAAAIAKFGNIPISPYTGLPDISIPLYTIKEGGFEIPMVLKYHASGIQVEQEATWVGLGWNLDVGGSINQQITGVSDIENIVFPTSQAYDYLKAEAGKNDHYSGVEMNTWGFPFCLTNDVGSLSFLRHHDAGRPNMYNFNLPNGSGKFFLDPKSKVPVQIGNKSKHYFITRSRIDGRRSEWDIKDTEGNRFFFDINDNGFSEDNNSLNYYTGIDPKLSYIDLPNGKRINFTYENGKYRLRTRTEVKSFMGDSPVDTSIDEIHSTNFHTKELSTIETSNIRVEFVLSTTVAEREDLDGDQLVNGYGAKRLNAIYIWDKLTNKKIKGFKFNYGYFNADISFYGGSNPAFQKRLKLISINEVGYKNDGIEILNSPYVFQYNETRNLPVKFSYARDHWGYFNGKDNRSLLPDLKPEILSGILYGLDELPALSLNFFMSSGTANRGMNPQFATTAILNKIIYPTGGHTVLNYEPNKFLNYRVFSAPEIDNNAGFITHRVDDYNYKNVIGNSVFSVPLYPDSFGKLTLAGFRAYFTRIDQTVSYDYFAGAYVKAWKVGVDGNRSGVYTWYIGSRNEFNQNGNSGFGPLNVDLMAAPGEHFLIESYLPNTPPLSMENSSIPKGLAGCTFSIKDLNVSNIESIGAGLRIASVENYSGLDILSDKTTYKYTKEGSVSTSGKLMSPIKNHAFFTQSKIVPVDQHNVEIVVLPVYNMQLASYSYNPLSGDAQGSHVGYDRVEVQQESGSQDNGRTVNYYKNKQSVTLLGNYGLYNKVIPNVPYYENGLVDSVQYFSSGGLLLRKTLNEYKLIEKKVNRGIAFFDLWVTYDMQTQPCPIGAMDSKWFAIFYPINTKWFLPSIQTELNYYPDGILTNKKGFDYNQFGQVTKEWNLDSKKDTISTAYQYPVDVLSPAGSIVQLMKDKKIYNLLLSQSTLLNTTKKLEKKDYTYLQNGSSNIKLQNLKTSFSDYPAFDEVSNIRYDASDNVLSFEKEGVVSSYIWGYGNDYLIAEITNAQLEDVAYSSFEPGASGNWVIASGNRNVTDFLTGSYSYNLSAGCISKSQLNVSKRYIVSYWSRSSAAVISGTNAVAGLSKNGWTYYEHIIPTGSSIVSLCGSVTIDELRLRPVDSEMSTYTYKPLIGVTSIVDVKGNISYYNYDSFQRLRSISDQDKNIIKSFCYNYAGQVTDCGTQP